MSGILDGQPVDAANSNPAWLAANGDDEAQGKIDFNDQAVGASTVSGAAVRNIQKNLNSISSFLGWALNGVYNLLPTWATTNRGSSSDTIKARIESIDTAFNGTTGHKHTGGAGDGAKVSASDLTNLNYFRADLGQVQVPSVSGASFDVSTQFASKTSGGSTAAAGVITSAPYNRCEIRDSENGSEVEDGSGNKVYGRITFSASVWTITFYIFNAGTESAYTIPSSVNIWIFFREVFSLATLPTIGADLGALGSLDATADVVDATAIQRGAVSTSSQTFAGLKLFKDLLGLVDTVTTAYYLRLVSTSSVALTAARDLIIDVKNASRTITMGGNLTIPSDATVSGTNTGDASVTSFGSSPNTAGASFSGQALTLQPADATHPGGVSTGSQTFGGLKLFQDLLGLVDTITNTFYLRLVSSSSVALTAARDLIVDVKNANRTLTLGADLTVSATATVSGTNSGDVTLGAFGSAPSATGSSLTGQALSLQPADGTHPGSVSLLAQTLGAGLKTFTDGLLSSAGLYGASEDDSSTTGTAASMATPAKTIRRLTNASLVSIGNIVAPASPQFAVLVNTTGASFTLVNDSGGTAANRIVTGTGADMTLANTAAVWLAYDPTSTRWRVIGGSGGGGSGGALLVTGSRGSPQSITAGSGIAYVHSATSARQLWFVQGSTAPVTVTANPQIAAGTTVGEELALVGRDDTNTVTLNDGTGLSLSGTMELAANSVLELFWDGSVWVETSRKV